MDTDPVDAGILAAKRNLSVRGMGVVFLVNGLILALFWAICYKALGGMLSAEPQALPNLARTGYAMVAFAALAYIVVVDLETHWRDGDDAVRAVTLDWLAWSLVPLAAYLALSALALQAGLPEPRHIALVEGGLAAALTAYGLFLTRRHVPVA